MKISVNSVRGVEVVSVSGVVDRRAAGTLSDTLVATVRNGSRALVVDLSEVTLLTHAGAPGLVVAAKLMETARGRMRVAGARPLVAMVLKDLGFNHLLRHDPTVAAAITALAGETRSDAPAARVENAA